MTRERLAGVRKAYDTVAESYAEQIPGLSAETTLDIAMLDDFAARVTFAGGGLVLDAGCGPGRITRYLQSRGLEIEGVDLSPNMVEVASRSYPDLWFRVGSLASLEVPDGALAGLLAWYSIIHTPQSELAAVFDEFHRVLRPGGYLLLGIQVGTGVVRVTRSYGHDIGVDLQLLLPADVNALLDVSGFSTIVSLAREPEGRERRPQAFLLARRSGERSPA